MASWMVHLRIAEKVLEKYDDLEETEYIVGNIAPDSGIPTKDWKTYVPDGKVSHFRIMNGDKEIIQAEVFFNQYLSKEKLLNYDRKQFSFYLGYYHHLLTDIMWADKIVEPSKERDREEYEKDSYTTVWKWKKDWYDLDFLYLKKHPDFHAFKVYENAEGFKNTFLDFFAEDAFDNRRQYITGFYHETRNNLEREYPCLTEQQMDTFVDYAVGNILKS